MRELPGRFQLRVDGSAPIPIANGRVTGDHVVFSGPLAEPEHLASLADKEIRWFIQSGRRIGDSFAPRGSAAPAEDLPWVFAALEDFLARFWSTSGAPSSMSPVSKRRWMSVPRGTPTGCA